MGKDKNISVQGVEGGVESGKVVYLTDGRREQQAREFAVLFRLAGISEAQFKVFGESLLPADKRELAAAMEAAARSLRV